MAKAIIIKARLEIEALRKNACPDSNIIARLENRINFQLERMRSDEAERDRIMDTCEILTYGITK
ncbi:hypothetical protein D3C87_1971110 [compost metagenome]